MKSKYNDTDLVRIREVYQISQRLEDKIDSVSNRISNIEGRVAVYAVLISALVAYLVSMFQK